MYTVLDDANKKQAKKPSHEDQNSKAPVHVIEIYVRMSSDTEKNVIYRVHDRLMNPVDYHKL